MDMTLIVAFDHVSCLLQAFIQGSKYLCRVQDIAFLSAICAKVTLHVDAIQLLTETQGILRGIEGYLVHVGQLLLRLSTEGGGGVGIAIISILVVLCPYQFAKAVEEIQDILDIQATIDVTIYFLSSLSYHLLHATHLGEYIFPHCRCILQATIVLP